MLTSTFHVKAGWRRAALLVAVSSISTVGADAQAIEADSTGLPSYVVRGVTMALAVPASLYGSAQAWKVTRARDGTGRINGMPMAELLLISTTVSSVHYSRDSAQLTIYLRSYHPGSIAVDRRHLPLLLPLLRTPREADSLQRAISEERAARSVIKSPPTPSRDTAAQIMPDPFVDVLPPLSVVTARWAPKAADTVRFRNLLWAKVETARTDSAWNTRTTTIPTRLARAANNEILQALRKIMPSLPRTAAGARLHVMIMHRDFASPIKLTLGEWTEWYVPAAAYRSLARADITLGQFYAQCFVLRDGTRVDVDLSAQGN